MPPEEKYIDHFNIKANFKMYSETFINLMTSQFL